VGLVLRAELSGNGGSDFEKSLDLLLEDEMKMCREKKTIA